MAKYIYICSHGHSGSTLLDLLLGAHSKVESLGELSFLPQDIALNLKCTCGLPIRECAVWREVIRRLCQHTGADLMRDPYALELGFPKAEVTIDRKHQTALYLARRELLLGMHYAQLRLGGGLLQPFLGSVRRSFSNNFLVYDIVRDLLGVDIVVDSSKSYLKAVGLYLERPQDVRVLLLTRDGRGVLYSNLKRNRPRSESVSSWMNQYNRALPLFKRHISADCFLQVKYEDLATMPEQELRRICEFIGIAFEQSMLNFASVPHHSTDGNNMRFLPTSDIRMDTQWQVSMSETDLRYFERRAGRLNRLLGYA